jgi:hypothetical protein
MLRTITYKWEDGKTLRLNVDQVEMVRQFVDFDPERFDRCLRFLAGLSGAPTLDLSGGAPADMGRL